jgi:hypothetical protein
VSELRSAPQELTVTLANPNIAYKRKEVYEKRCVFPPCFLTLLDACCLKRKVGF